jgi:hypothetical protein
MGDVPGVEVTTHFDRKVRHEAVRVADDRTVLHDLHRVFLDALGQAVASRRQDLDNWLERTDLAWRRLRQALELRR